jgi:hypothetical protein
MTPTSSSPPPATTPPAPTQDPYQRSGNVLTLADRFEGQVNQGLGERISMTDRILAVGSTAPMVDTYSIRNTGVSHLATLTSPNPLQSTSFGTAVATNGQLLAVSRPNDAALLIYRRSGVSWDLEASLNAPLLGPMAWAEDTLIAASGSNLNLYRYEADSWTLKAVKATPDSQGATSLAATATLVVSGRVGATHTWSVAGASLVHGHTAAPGGAYGASLAMAGHRLAVGDPTGMGVSIYEL